ncbi:hypothetical protein OKJ48_09945 [Streptomyces kunmingensis]|uniref:Uncharacterized protein n=1 Tax=Streptomyces kunmingensis TaxID=68225 RepID=A0ABU6C771_9ACTN|nr:hypothetical protein [Streptomyces kunmingensis]MEB3960562.1 hypothetical protein [Streptomyces kunmingensis]
MSPYPFNRYGALVGDTDLGVALEAQALALVSSWSRSRSASTFVPSRSAFGSHDQWRHDYGAPAEPTEPNLFKRMRYDGSALVLRREDPADARASGLGGGAGRHGLTPSWGKPVSGPRGARLGGQRTPTAASALRCFGVGWAGKYR